MTFREELDRALAAFREADITDLVPRLTLVFILVYRVGSPEIQFGMIVAGLFGLMLPGLHRSATLWFVLTGLFGLRVFLVGHNLDNHGYLLPTWCLALGCAYSLEDPRRALATQARLLVGWCFLFATVWKAFLSDDYMSGDFFHLTYLNDHRFIDVTRLVSGGLTGEVLADNRRLISSLASQPDPVILSTTARIPWIAMASTWWTVLIEAVVAIFFLLPRSRVRPIYRDGSLLLFAITTYAIAPIMGFGWQLMVMGIAQTDPDDSRTRLLYLGCCALIALYKYVPWLGWIAGGLGV